MYTHDIRGSGRMVMRRKNVVARAVTVSAVAALLVVIGVIVSVSAAPASPVLARRTVGPDPSAVVVDDRSGHVFVANADDTLSMLDARDGRVLRAITLDGNPTRLIVDEHSWRLFVVLGGAGAAAGAVTILDTRSGAILHTVDVGGAASAIAIGQHTARAYVSHDDVLSTLNPANGRIVGAVPVGFDPTTGYAPEAIAVDGRAGHVFTANESNGSVSMFDAAGGRLLRVIPLGTPLSGESATFGAHPLVIAEGYHHLFVASHTQSGSDVRMIDTRNGHVVRRINVAWSPEDVLLDTRTDRVFVRSTAGPSLLLDARTGAVVRTLALGPGVWNARDAQTVDQGSGRVYMLQEAARDNTGAATGTGRVLVVDGAAGTLVRAIPVGLLPTDIAVDGRSGRVFVSSVNDAEYQRYGYRSRSIGGATDAWSWVPQLLRDRLPRAPQRQPAPSGPLNGTVRVIDTTR